MANNKCYSLYRTKEERKSQRVVRELDTGYISLVLNIRFKSQKRRDDL